MLWGQVSIWGQLGSLGSKGHFHLKCCNSSMLHSMTIRLIHVHQLETLYLLNEVKCQPGVIWGHRGQNVIVSKMLLLLQNTRCYLYVTQWVSSNLSWFASLNNKAFGNLFCNPEKSFHTSPRSSDSNNRGYRPFFKLNNGICIYKKS